MSQMHFNPKDISNQIIYHLTPHPHPHHIRDKVSRYLYMNPAMAELLNVPKGVPVEGKRLSEIKTDTSEFFEGIKKQEERVIQKETAVSLLITANFGKENRLQPYIFDIHPFFDETGQLVGTLAEARQCQFFSLLDYIQGKSPKTLTPSLLNTMLTQRELEIIFYAYHALSIKEVGEYLNLSHRTVENKLQCIYEKMGGHHQKGFRKYIQDSGLNQFIPQHLLASSIQIID
ncbi:MAG: PAS and helix-turn-helix domain-containing protein [Candidatus Hamiltonella defensa (Ceratovacuna japonica)]|uniref:Transcriptional regulator, PAS and GerE domains n=4 Tax=Candidatus Williamhamiltonella defendens TaxID=138072 RepID=C4K5B0_HAMD5|nr:PAS and helix-turn-helix domain-containing protein [Candidatus Hamiltonella defensa]ACQ67753.1 putative transcriptional regulator, PAS and GerE domains [Candidatus Hamiltonella defensa 5AT (Acyrthosiphon pisum)]